MAAAPSPWLEEAFRSAKEDFLKNLSNPTKYDFSRIHSIEDVYDATDAIQKQQAQTKTLRGLNKLEPFINGLKEYAAVVEVFIQAKADILSLIWGPLKLLLQIASSVITAFDKVVKVLADIGNTLPVFQKYATLFEDNVQVRQCLSLFYADILEFYAILLNFLAHRKRNVFLESLWPNIRGKIDIVKANIDQHRILMTSHTTLEHVLQASQARKRALEEYENQQEFRNNQNFTNYIAQLSPQLYDTRLAQILEQSTVDSGLWLEKQPDFTRWLDPDDNSTRCLWLHGIPGSGKTFLAANIIRRLELRVPFIFLTHENPALGGIIQVCHSLIFQILKLDPTARPILFDTLKSQERKFANDPDCAKSLLKIILQNTTPTFIIIDGLDEVEERLRASLLSTILGVLEECPQMKLLVCSRQERDIMQRLKDKSVGVRVDKSNTQAIQEFAKVESANWILELQDYGADEAMCAAAKEAVARVVERSLGMFLYTKLVLDVLKEQGTSINIHQELQRLPDGLDQAYGRIHARITQKIPKSLQTIARRTLLWIACARRPLREEQLLQILAVDPGSTDFTRGQKEYRDIRKACGPIIEEIDGVIRFVHFTAREYLLGEQSENFLTLPEAHASAALTCATYLSFSSLDLVFENSANDTDQFLELQNRIKDGQFVLFDYAAIEWLDHLKDGGSKTPPSDTRELMQALSRLFQARGTCTSSIDDESSHNHLSVRFKHFEAFPSIRNRLENAYSYWGQAQYGLLCDENDIDSKNDVVILLSSVSTFRRQLEKLFCPHYTHKPGCNCAKLSSYYGRTVFYCSHAFCSRFHRGFVTEAERSQHELVHNRYTGGSEFQQAGHSVGLQPNPDLKQHVLHPTGMLTQEPASETANSINHNISQNNTSIDMIIDAILQKDIVVLRSLLMTKNINQTYVAQLLMDSAARDSTPEVLTELQHWLRIHCSLPYQPSLELVLAEAIEMKNQPNIKWCLSQCADVHANTGFTSSRHMHHETREFKANRVPRLSGFFRAFSLWDPDLMDFLIEDCGVKIPLKPDNPGRIFVAPGFSGSSFASAMDRLEAMRKYILWPDAFDKGVHYAVLYQSLISLQICLQNGGDPNSNNGVTPLYMAITAGSNIGAEMAKLLIQYGAQRYKSGTRKMLIEFAGMRKVEAYFGTDWADFVQRTVAGEDIQGGRNRKK